MTDNIGDYARHAAVWDWSGYDRGVEFDFWCRIAKPYGMKVISAMCAIGEAGAYMAQKGFDVTAIDITKEMIEEGQRRYLEIPSMKFICADVRDFVLEDKMYDFAFIGSADLHHMSTEKDVAKTLTSIHKHLRKGGGLGLELWYPADNSWSSPKRRFDPFKTDIEASMKVWKEGQTEYNAKQQMVSISQVVYIQEGDQVESFDHSFQLKLYSRELLLQIISQCGYHIVHEYGGYALEDWEPGSSKWIIEAVKI